MFLYLFLDVWGCTIPGGLLAASRTHFEYLSLGGARSHLPVQNVRITSWVPVGLGYDSQRKNMDTAFWRSSCCHKDVLLSNHDLYLP